MYRDTIVSVFSIILISIALAATFYVYWSLVASKPDRSVCRCFMYIWLSHEYSLLVHLAMTSMLSIFKLKIVHYVSIVRIGRWLYILYAYVLLEVYTLMRGNAKILHADVRNAIFKCTKIKPHHFKQNVSNFPGVKIS